MRWSSAALLTCVFLSGAAIEAQDAPDFPLAGETATLIESGVDADTAPAPADSLLPPAADTTARDSVFVPHVAGSNGGELTVMDPCPLGRHRRTAEVAAGGVFVGANLELFRRFKQAWWSGEKADRFYFKADWDEDFRDQDKWGHMWGGYHLTRAGNTLLRAACVSEKKSLIISAVYATLFQLQIEIWDGMYEKYGFSYPDLLANTAGMGLAVLHAVKPGTQVIKPTISYRRTEALKRRGPNDEIRHSLDYSGQTYWFSFDIDAMLPEPARAYWPGLLRLSVGHSITDWVLPRPDGVPETTQQGIVRARRKILLSLDVDADKLPGNHPAWRFIKHQLSYIRLPAPAIQITPDARFIRWYR